MSTAAANKQSLIVVTSFGFCELSKTQDRLLLRQASLYNSNTIIPQVNILGRDLVLGTVL